jgi:hypothetical protein
MKIQFYLKNGFNEIRIFSRIIKMEIIALISIVINYAKKDAPCMRHVFAVCCITLFLVFVLFVVRKQSFSCKVDSALTVDFSNTNEDLVADVDHVFDLLDTFII